MNGRQSLRSGNGKPPPKKKDKRRFRSSANLTWEPLAPSQSTGREIWPRGRRPADYKIKCMVELATRLLLEQGLTPITKRQRFRVREPASFSSAFQSRTRS